MHSIILIILIFYENMEYINNMHIFYLLLKVTNILHYIFQDTPHYATDCVHVVADRDRLQQTAFTLQQTDKQ